MPAPDAILFDIGDTILEERRFDLEAGIRAVVGQRPDVVTELCQAFRSQLQENHRIDRELYLPKWLGEHFPDCGNASTHIIEGNLWDSIVTLAPVPGVAIVLNRLRNDKISIAAISNAYFSGRILGTELEKHGLGHFFRFVLSSADIGFRKPHPVIFEAALLQLGVRAERTWFVGDTMKEDILGAARAGLQPILFSRDAPEPTVDSPVLHVSDWREFVVVYERACQNEHGGNSQIMH